MATISFSQYSMWKSCPHLWRLKYIDNVIPKDESIHLHFGTSVHEALQSWLTLLHNESKSSAETHDTVNAFVSKFQELMVNSDISYTNELYLEFVNDGRKIITWLKENSDKFFNSDNVSVFKIEHEIRARILPEYSVDLVGYVDVILYNSDTKRYTIIDIKTSSKGWSKFDKSNDTKMSQVLIYKKFLSDELNIPLDSIDVYFLIVKRKLNDPSENMAEKFAFPSIESRISMAIKSYQSFVKQCFTIDGERIDKEYLKLGLTTNHCNFCYARENSDLCKVTERIQK